MLARPLMLEQIRSSSAEPPSHQVARQVREAIRLGRLRPGARLPPVRTLARQLGVNPNTIARAYLELGSQGLVSGRHGGGTRVAEEAEERMTELRRAGLRDLASRALATALAAGHAPEDLQATLAEAAARWRGQPGQRVLGPRPHPGELRFVGSHDPSVELLADRLAARRPPVQLVTRFVGSLEGLMALAHGEANLAGCHLLDAETGEYNLPFVKRILPGRPLLLITLATRQQGFMWRAGTLLRADLETIARRRLRLANRQPGSGTRVLLDHLLRRAGISPRRIAGYDSALPTHLAVAQAVAARQADVALGIKAAARAQGLDFHAVRSERYELVIPAGLAASWEIRALRAEVARRPLARLAAALEGYDFAAAGKVRRVA
jgi:putative molybdopterin biosynthesis protein